MKGICLNLDHRKDRWHHAQNEFILQGLQVERFSAIEHENPLTSFNLSQKAILESITENTLVFEDDVLFVSHRFKEVLSTVPDDWDMLYFGGNVLESLQHVSGHWWRCLHTWTTHAVAYTPKAAKYISERFDPYGPFVYDDFLKNQIQPELKCYICKPFICVQRESYSDLWKQNAFYQLLETQNKLL